MNSKGHLALSLVKSGLRILAIICAAATGCPWYFYFGFTVAEILGVLEELVDNR